MPEISRFFGIIMAMFYGDHDPPHFHARYGKHKAAIRIQDFRVLEGDLPPRALGLIIEWASTHQEELRMHPDAGSKIKGAAGLRKLRWAIEGQGKSGGIRVIYYWSRPREDFHALRLSKKQTG